MFLRGDVMSKKRLVTFIACLLIFVVNGCSSKKQTGILKEIKQRGKLVVASEAAFAPFSFVEEGELVGYGADILAEIAKSLDVELEQLDVPFSGILPGLEEKKFDFTSVMITSERQEKICFHKPYC